jgi:hypothetical protein
MESARNRHGAMSSIDSTHTAIPRSRSRRRLAAWLAFGAVGLATGAVWATGFATTGGQVGANDPAQFINPSDPADHNPDLQNKISANASGLDYDWDGRWGSVTDTQLFKVDLTGSGLAANKYNVGFLLTNGTLLSGTTGSGWSTIQLKIELLQKAASATCADSDFAGATTDQKVMAFDADDAGVYFNNLDGDKVYCVGIKTADGHDINGTFLRRDSDTVAPTVYPEFIATVDRSQ